MSSKPLQGSPEASPTTKACCPSRIIEEFSYVWTIHRFDRLTCGRQDYIQSPTFTTSRDVFSWSLKLYPNYVSSSRTNTTADSSGDSDVTTGNESSASKDMIFYLFLEENASTDSPYVFAKFQISVLHGGNKYRPSGYEDFIQFVPGQGWRIVWRKELFDLEGHVSPDGKLTIGCDIWVRLNELKNKPAASGLAMSLMRDMWRGGGGGAAGECLEKMLEDEMFSDVVLSVRGREFPAHRAVLASHSTVFREMFVPSKDSVHNRVLIVDIRVEVVEAMLRFIYTGKLPDNFSELSEGLLAAANKYKLERLKIICCENLGNEIKTDTAARLLVLADSNSADRLKTRVVQFIASQPQAVVQSEGWHLLKQHPLLLADLCQVLARGERSKKTRRSASAKKE